MSDSDNFTDNGIIVEEAKAKELLRWLIQTEKINIKTREKNDLQMIAAIKKKIEEVVQCY